MWPSQTTKCPCFFHSKNLFFSNSLSNQWETLINRKFYEYTRYKLTMSRQIESEWLIAGVRAQPCAADNRYWRRKWGSWGRSFMPLRFCRRPVSTMLSGLHLISIILTEHDTMLAP